MQGIHDVAFMTLRFPSGVVANVELSWLAPSKLRRTAIVGSNKMVVYEDGTPEPVRVFDRGVVYEDPETSGSISCHIEPVTSAHPASRLPSRSSPSYAEFVRLIRTEEIRRSRAGAPGRDACRGGQTSLTGGGAPVAVSSYVGAMA